MILLVLLCAACATVGILRAMAQRKPEPRRGIAKARYQRDEGDETDAIPEGLGVSAPRPIGTRTSPVAPVGKWTPAERELWIGVLEELERHQ